MRPGKPLAIGLPLLLVVAAGCAVTLSHGAASPRLSLPATVARPGRCSRPAFPAIGVVTAPPQDRTLPEFSRATGIRPGLLEFYEVFGERFDQARMTVAERAGAEPLMQWNPARISLAAVADGRYDAYLRAFASAARRYGCPLVISFGHEMNGDWFSWGYRHVPPRVFTAAWRRIVTVFRHQGATSVTWLWTANIQRPGNRHVSAIAPWWPGGAYVTWAGIDGYFRKPSDTFATVFGGTLVQVRHFTRHPVLITETSAGPGPRQPAQITSLFAGIRDTPGVIGFAWFDINARERWDIDHDPAAFAAFRKAARRYLR